METLETLPIPAPGEAQPRAVVTITPWIDPVVDQRGHDPRSSYVERFWLGTLGPTATWLVRRLVAGFDAQPDGYELDLATTAQILGLSYSKGASSAFSKAFSRCIMFGLAHQRSDGYAVRRMLPDVARRHLSRHAGPPPAGTRALARGGPWSPSRGAATGPLARRRDARRRRRCRVDRTPAGGCRGPRHHSCGGGRTAPRQLHRRPRRVIAPEGPAHTVGDSRMSVVTKSRLIEERNDVTHPSVAASSPHRAPGGPVGSTDDPTSLARPPPTTHRPRSTRVDRSR